MGTIEYYDSDPEGYSGRTLNAEIPSALYCFLRLVPSGGRILDLGCGSGRDTLAIRAPGFSVVPVDGSPGMCRVAAENTGSEVRNVLFSELDYKEEFDGVWACASLLHVPSRDLRHILGLVRDSLVPGGTMCMSFKEGTFEGVRDGRYYTDMTPGSLIELAESAGFVTVEVFTETEASRGVPWVSAIIRKPHS